MRSVKLLQEMDFSSFMIQGVDGEFNFLPKGGFDDNQGSLNTSFDDELPPVHPSTTSFLEVGEKSKAVGKRKLVADALQEGSHHRAQKALFPSAKELKDATDCHWVVAHVTPPSCKHHLRDISIEELCDIHDRAYMRQAVLENMLNKREIKRDKAYAKLEKKFNEALQDLDKNPLVSDMRSEIKTLQGQEIDSLRQDRAAIVSKVIPDITMKLGHSDEMGVLVARLVRAAIIHCRCTAFEEVTKLKEPFILERMSNYRTSSKDEYDRARVDMANASYPFLFEFTSNPYATVEQLLSMKPRSLRSLNAP
ncbi:hypothetical protein Tco_0845645 [Tanacetum coccineum]